MHEELHCGICFCQATYFDMFWGTLGISGSKKVKNSPIFKEWHPEAGNLHRDVIFDCRFYIVTHLGQIISFDPFWNTLGVKTGQKLPISLKITPQKLRICTENWFLTRDLILSLILAKSKLLTLFDSFYLSRNNNQQKLQICSSNAIVIFIFD